MKCERGHEVHCEKCEKIDAMIDKRTRAKDNRRGWRYHYLLVMLVIFGGFLLIGVFAR